MKPIATIGLFSQIASVVLWSAVASAQAAPAAAGAKATPEAASKPAAATKPEAAPKAAPKEAAVVPTTASTAAVPSSQPGATTPAVAQPADAPATATEAAAVGAVSEQATAEGDVADQNEKKGKKKDKDKDKKKDKKKNRDKDKGDNKDGEEAAAEQAEGGALVGDFVGGDPWGNTKGALRAKGLTFRFLAQTQYQQSFGVESQNADPTYVVPEESLAKSGDGWDLSRLFFGITAEPTKYLHLKMTTDFAEIRKGNGSKAVKQAYAELRVLPKHLHLTAGVLKLPFSIHELDSVAAYEFTSSGRTNAFLNKMDFIGRDIGAAVMVAPLEKQQYLKLTLGAYQGHATKENASPVGTVGARIESEFLKGLRVGAGMTMVPKTIVQLNALDTSGNNIVPNPANPTYPRAETWKKGNAFGADITFQHAGLMVRGEGLIGDRVDYDTRYGAEQWAAAWGIVAYKFDAGPVKLEPAVRVEYLDTDFKRDAGLYRQFTLAIGTHFNSATKLIVDATRMIVENNTPYIDQPQPLRQIPYNALSATTVTGRLQIAL